MNIKRESEKYLKQQITAIDGRCFELENKIKEATHDEEKAMMVDVLAEMKKETNILQTILDNISLNGDKPRPRIVDSEDEIKILPIYFYYKCKGYDFERFVAINSRAVEVVVSTDTDGMGINTAIDIDQLHPDSSIWIQEYILSSTKNQENFKYITAQQFYDKYAEAIRNYNRLTYE